MSIIKLPQGSRYQGLPGRSSNHLRPPRLLDESFFVSENGYDPFLAWKPNHSCPTFEISLAVTLSVEIVDYTHLVLW